MLWNRWYELEKQSVWLRGKLVSLVLIFGQNLWLLE
jgi:hypothetical protein